MHVYLYIHVKLSVVTVSNFSFILTYIHIYSAAYFIDNKANGAVGGGAAYVEGGGNFTLTGYVYTSITIYIPDGA